MVKDIIKGMFFSLLIIFLASGEELVWPLPPEQPKIKWVSVIRASEDLQEEKSFFAKLADLLFGKEKKKIVKPTGSFVKGNKLYFTDTGAKALFIFNTRKKSIKIIDHIDNYALSSPVDVVVDKKGKIYISDSVLGTVFITNEDGDYLGKIGGGAIIRPTGLSIDEKRDYLYITDTVGCKIYVISLKDKKLVRKIGRPGTKEGEFNRPTYTAVDSEGNLYVADSMNARIQIFDKEGRFIRMFGTRGTTIGTFANPRGIALDSDGNIYVTDTLLSAVQIFNKKGDLLLVFGHYGTQNGEFAYPIDVSISKSDYIYISDSYNMRIQVFKYLKEVQKND
ncbi:SMP-30/gluconolactonase/LRE family protein [Persephonella sp.]